MRDANGAHTWEAMCSCFLDWAPHNKSCCSQISLQLLQWLSLCTHTLDLALSPKITCIFKAFLLWDQRSLVLPASTFSFLFYDLPGPPEAGPTQSWQLQATAESTCFLFAFWVRSKKTLFLFICWVVMDLIKWEYLESTWSRSKVIQEKKEEVLHSFASFFLTYGGPGVRKRKKR